MPKKTLRETAQWLLGIAGKFLKAKELQEFKERLKTMEDAHKKMCEVFASVHDALGMRVTEDKVEFGDGSVIRGVDLVRGVLWARQCCQDAEIPITVRNNDN